MIDESLFEPFYESTNKSLWAYVYRMVGDAAAADDILQDAYVRFLQSDAPTEHASTMKAYLYRIATNLAHDHFRKMKRRRKFLERNTNESEALYHLPEGENRYEIGRAFHELPLKQRSILWMAYVEEYSHAEIAKMVNVSEKSIRVLLFRAKQRLIGILRKMGIESERA